MIFSPINIRKELSKERENRLSLLNHARILLEKSATKDKEIAKRLKSDSPESCFLNIHVTKTENIYTIEDIYKICVRFRLRFLDTSLFRPSFPYSAIVAIKLFEKEYAIKAESFKIIAPAGVFKLENINKDPLLFIPLDAKTFYLVHQWGNDLKWYRRIFTWPLQNLKTFLIFLFLLGFLFAFSLPTSVMHIFNLQSEIYLRAWLTIHTFIGLFGISLWLGISFDKTFSSMNWESKYYNN